MKLFFLIAAAGMLGFAVYHMRGDSPSWQLTNVTGHLPDLQFSLSADTGEPVTETAYPADITLLYFGFTSCADMCPTTLARVKTLFRQLGKDADRVRLLFVTVDPLHDTPAQLHGFLAGFDPVHMTGLTGAPDTVQFLAKRYRTAYQPASATQPVTHSDTLYVFDADRHARLIGTSADTDAAFIHDMRQLVHEYRP